MGFLSGRLSCLRFRFSGPPPRIFGPEHLEMLDNHSLGKQRLASSDGVSVGWIAGDHILDLRYDLAKNIVNDTLQFALRVDSVKLPPDLLRAYTQVDLEALAANNPSGIPSARQKKEARQSAIDRLEAEAADGRFIRRTSYPVMWDALSNEVLFGAHSAAAVDHFVRIFQETFDNGLELLDAGFQAHLQAEAREQTRSVDDAKLSPYVPGKTGTDVAWLMDEANRNFLGNEFLLWLWFVLDSASDSIQLSDGSEVAVMLTRSLSLECPRGETGKETFQADGPTHLPEAKLAIQAGKLPRKVGLILVRHDQQYELTLQGETLGISAAKLPAPEGDSDQAIREERVTQIRHFLETIDLLYDAFGQHRFGQNWSKEFKRIQQWLNKNSMPQFSPTGTAG